MPLPLPLLLPLPLPLLLPLPLPFWRPVLSCHVVLGARAWWGWLWWWVWLVFGRSLIFFCVPLLVLACPRYDDMVESVRKLAQLGVQLTVEERNLLSVAYKVPLSLLLDCVSQFSFDPPPVVLHFADLFPWQNVVGARRASWRVLSSIEAKEKEKGEAERADEVSAYRGRVEAELEKICLELLRILEEYLLPKDNTTEGQVFYWKMAGDYYRCVCPVGRMGPGGVVAFCCFCLLRLLPLFILLESRPCPWLWLWVLSPVL